MLFAGTVALVIETRAWVNKGLEYGEMLWNLRALFVNENNECV